MRDKKPRPQENKTGNISVELRDLTEQKITAERRAHLQHDIPTNFEDATSQLHGLQTEINRCFGENRESDLISFLEAKVGTYRIAKKLLQQLGMYTLVPTLEEEEQSAQELLDKVSLKEWTLKYQKLYPEFTAAFKRRNYAEAETIAHDLINLVSIAEEKSRANEYNEDADKYQKMREELEKVCDSVALANQYQEFEQGFNDIENLLQNHLITKAGMVLKNLRCKWIGYISHIEESTEQNPSLAPILGESLKLEEKFRQTDKKMELTLRDMFTSANSLDTDFESVSTELNLQELNSSGNMVNRAQISAKVVLLGDSSVGKTHLIMAMTGGTYFVTHGSTVGIDKYVKPVKLPFENYDGALCFWDIGGNWNFRALNDLLLHDAAAIAIVYDMTRPVTFSSMQYWLSVVRAARKVQNCPLFIIGNKLDAGGSAIPPQDVTSFMEAAGIKRIYETSALFGTGVPELLEDITVSINWYQLIRGFDSQFLQQLNRALQYLKKVSKVIRTTVLFHRLLSSFPKVDPLMLKAALQYYATQEIIQFGRDGSFVILDPERVDKFVARIVSLAANANGQVPRAKIEKIWHENKQQLNDLLEYLQLENICYTNDEGSIVFPHTIHQKGIVPDPYVQGILNASSQTLKQTIVGPRDIIFARFQVVLTRELGVPRVITNTAGLWVTGDGASSSALLVDLVQRQNHNIIRLRSGGEQCLQLIQSSHDLLIQLTELFKWGKKDILSQLNPD